MPDHAVFDTNQRARNEVFRSAPKRTRAEHNLTVCKPLRAQSVLAAAIALGLFALDRFALDGLALRRLALFATAVMTAIVATAARIATRHGARHATRSRRRSWRRHHDRRARRRTRGCTDRSTRGAAVGLAMALALATNHGRQSDRHHCTKHGIRPPKAEILVAGRLRTFRSPIDQFPIPSPIEIGYREPTEPVASMLDHASQFADLIDVEGAQRGKVLKIEVL